MRRLTLGINKRRTGISAILVVALTFSFQIGSAFVVPADAAAGTPPTPLPPTSIVITPGGSGQVTSGKGLTFSGVYRTPGDAFVNSKGHPFRGYLTFEVRRPNGELVVSRPGNPSRFQTSPIRVEDFIYKPALLSAGSYEVWVIAKNVNESQGLTAAAAPVKVPFTVVDDPNSLGNRTLVDEFGCTDCFATATVPMFSGTIGPNQSLAVPIPIDDIIAASFMPTGGAPTGIGGATHPSQADPIYVGEVFMTLRTTGGSASNASGELKLSYPDRQLPNVPTIQYPSSLLGSLVSRPVFDTVAATRDEVVLTNTGASAMAITLHADGWQAWITGDEVVLLDEEDNAEISDEEIADLIADSDPILGGPNPSTEPPCTSNAAGATACWGEDVPGVTGQTSPEATALADLPCGLTTQSELRWTFLSRYEACRRWNVSLVLDPGDPTETYIRAELGMRVFFRPREAVVKMIATMTWRGMDSASGIPHYDEDQVQSRIDYDCSGLVNCSLQRSIQDFNSDNPIHTVDTGWLGVTIGTGDIESIAGDLSVGFGLRQLQWSEDWVPARGPFQIPLARCDGVTYMKHFGANTKGCIISEHIPKLKFRPALETNIKESARHIRRAQVELGFPGGSTADPLHRVRGIDRDRNRNRALAKCRNDLPDDPGSCDEYPFASTREGCFLARDCSVARIPLDDNRRSGSRLGAFYKAKRILSGDAFSVVVLGSIPDPD